jgi:hypothetical protein
MATNKLLLNLKKLSSYQPVWYPFLPHKPILCRGLCGEGACVAVTVAMDHPSRGFYLPSQVEKIHEHTVPYG